MAQPAPVPGGRSPSSRARIDLLLARLEGLFGFVFSVLSLPVLSETAATLKPEWAWGVSMAIFGAVAVALICSLAGRGIRFSMGLVAVVFVVALLLWPLAVRSPDAALGVQPWLWYIAIVATAAAAIAFPTVGAAVYAVTVPIVFVVLRMLPAGGGAPWQSAVLDGIYALVLGGFVLIVITGLRSAASRVDAAQALAVRRYAEAATRDAAEQERTRVDTVIHDRVLSTLLAAARADSPAERTLVVQMAERALVALQSADAETEGSADQPLSVLVERCRALAGALDAEVGFAAEGEHGALVPARVLEGFYSATVQAVVNSVQHAGGEGRPGSAVRRSISLHGWADAGFSVVVRDDGVGFDLAAIPADRLGVRISIRERIGSVGGVAGLLTAPGEGTVVVMEWSPAAGEVFA